MTSTTVSFSLYNFAFMANGNVQNNHLEFLEAGVTPFHQYMRLTESCSFMGGEVIAYQVISYQTKPRLILVNSGEPTKLL